MDPRDIRRHIEDIIKSILPKLKQNLSGEYYDPLLVSSVEEVTPGLTKVERIFDSQTIWNVDHGLGCVPSITIWNGSLIINGFGNQAFGESPFGEGEASQGMELDEFAIVELIDLDNIKITWPSDTSGYVILIG